jgi:hypothetical protein
VAASWTKSVGLNRWVQLILLARGVVRPQRESHDQRNIFGNVSVVPVLL